MSSNSTIDDADLKSRLARFGIKAPITDTTRKVLFNKLQSLEMNSKNKQTTQSDPNCELMDTTSNDLNEYEIREELSKLGYKQVALTNTTLPVLSNIIRRRK